MNTFSNGKSPSLQTKAGLEHSRGVSGERRTVALNALVDEALNLACHVARARMRAFNITLERELDPGLAPIESGRWTFSENSAPWRNSTFRGRVHMGKTRN